MRSLLIIISFLCTSTTFAQSYELLEETHKPKTEYHGGKQVAYVTKDSVTLAVALSKDEPGYGKYYQLGVVVTNGSNQTFDFSPEDLVVKLLNNRDTTVDLYVYSSEGYARHIKREQSWLRFFNQVIDGVFSDGLNSGMAESEQTRIMHRSELLALNNGYLTKNTLHPGDVISGFINIAFAKGKVLMLRIPVNGVNYDFRWNVKKK